MRLRLAEFCALFVPVSPESVSEVFTFAAFSSSSPQSTGKYVFSETGFLLAISFSVVSVTSTVSEVPACSTASVSPTASVTSATASAAFSARLPAEAGLTTGSA